MTTRNVCGKRIKLARINKDMKQIDLCAALEVEKGMEISQTTLSEIEMGRRTVKDLDLIVFAEVLEVNPLWLLYGDKPPAFGKSPIKN